MDLKYEVINKKYSNIKQILKLHFEISDRLLTKLKKKQKIFKNGVKCYINESVNIKDIILVNLDFNEKSENILPVKLDLNIIFEDEYLLILNKPAGLPVHPSILHYENSISNGVQYYYNSKNIITKIRPVNRLDKETSGIVVFAKSEYIQECLIRQMKSNLFIKKYYAILEGHLEKTYGTIYAPISRKANSIIEREINSNGEKAITHFKLIKNYENSNTKLSFVEFQLETGRTHQIRVHCKHIKHPILGDSLYGNSSNLISRQALHAYNICFVHPVTKKNIDISIDLPTDINKIL